MAYPALKKERPEMIEDLERSGFTPQQSRGLIQAMTDVISSFDLATRAELRELREEIKELRQELRAEMKELRQEMKQLQEQTLRWFQWTWGLIAVLMIAMVGWSLFG